jgi:hypothetical protein
MCFKRTGKQSFPHAQLYHFDTKKVSYHLRSLFTHSLSRLDEVGKNFMDTIEENSFIGDWIDRF